MRHRSDADDGRVVHKARGVCGGCYRRAQELGDMPPLINNGPFVPRCACGRRLETPRRREVGACTICETGRPEVRWDDVVEDAEWLADTGVVMVSAANRLGVTIDALERALYRHGRPDIIHALRGTDVVAVSP